MSSPDDELDSGGDTGGVIVVKTAEDYLNDDAILPWKWVDILGFLGDWLKATFILTSGVLSGLTIGSTKAFLKIKNTITDSIRDVLGALFAVPVEAQEQAVNSVGQQLNIFGLFALPTAMVVYAAMIAALATVVYTIWGI